MNRKVLRKVTIFQPRVPKYRASFFAKLKQVGVNSGIEYHIVAPFDVNDFRLDEDFLNINVERIKTFKLKILKSEIHVYNLRKAFNKSNLVITEHALHDFIALSRLIKSQSVPLALWGHGRTFTEKSSFGKELLKKRMIRQSDWYFAYTRGVADYVSKVQNSSEKVTILNNSNDVFEIESSLKNLQTTSTESIRKSLGLFSDNTAVFIGALDDSKRINFILESFRRIKSEIPDFELAVCGKGPELDKFLELENLGIHYLGYADSILKAKLSRIGLFILNPGRVGLLAVDSFCLSLPIITTDWEFHAPEFEYLENSKTAIITKNSVEEYASGIVDYVNNQELIKSMKKNCFNNSSSYSIDKMVENFHQGVEDFFRELDRA